MAKQRKVIVTAAITGGIHTPTMTPYLPKGPQEVMQNAIDAANAGASIVHIHARRDVTGQPTADFDSFEQILSGIKKKSNVVIGITTGGAQGMTVEERFAVIDRFKPEMASANGGSMFHTCQAVIGAMRAQKYGKIVNLASVSAFGNVGQSNYGAAKAAVIGLTKCLARECARNNITVNAVAPSYVNTDMLRAVPEETMQRFIDAVPAHRLAEPSEIAAVVSFLCGDDSSFVTGECIIASGGSYM